MPHSPARKRAGAHFFWCQRKGIYRKASLYLLALTIPSLPLSGPKRAMSFQLVWVAAGFLAPAGRQPLLQRRVLLLAKKSKEAFVPYEISGDSVPMFPLPERRDAMQARPAAPQLSLPTYPCSPLAASHLACARLCAPSHALRTLHLTRLTRLTRLPRLQPNSPTHSSSRPGAAEQPHVLTRPQPLPLRLRHRRGRRTRSSATRASHQPSLPRARWTRTAPASISASPGCGCCTSTRLFSQWTVRMHALHMQMHMHCTCMHVHMLMHVHALHMHCTHTHFTHTHGVCTARTAHIRHTLHMHCVCRLLQRRRVRCLSRARHLDPHGRRARTHPVCDLLGCFGLSHLHHLVFAIPGGGCAMRMPCTLEHVPCTRLARAVHAPCTRLARALHAPCTRLGC